MIVKYKGAYVLTLFNLEIILGVLLFAFLHYKANAGFTYRVLKNPPFAHVMCNELVAKVLE